MFLPNLSQKYESFEQQNQGSGKGNHYQESAKSKGTIIFPNFQNSRAKKLIRAERVSTTFPTTGDDSLIFRDEN